MKSFELPDELALLAFAGLIGLGLVNLGHTALRAYDRWRIGRGA